MSSSPLYDSTPLPSLIDQLLAEQQSVAAVETFARRHDEGEFAPELKIYEERFRIDHSELRPGQQLAFQVDLDACTGCKSCVTACHSMNGLAPEETWRDVGLVVGQGGFAQTVTTACHHCEDPACLAGCPVKAYEKDPVTGIVRHLDDQCIGCQYCVLKCPYDVPKYSQELKIVRKCDMCTGRLSEGESPACVQGCPTGAISIAIVDLVERDRATELIPGLGDTVPDSRITRPTTRYVSNRLSAPDATGLSIPRSTFARTSLRPADVDNVRPRHAHDPLAIMLVLLQLSIGALGIGLAGSVAGLVGGSALSFVLGLAAVTAVAGLGAATMHLGRPLYAFRAFLGWRTSWMSREIIVIGAYVPAVALAAAASLVVHFGGVLGLEASPVLKLAAQAEFALQSAALLAGGIGMVCSMMIYIDTRRAAWSFSRTGPLFMGTGIALGALGVSAAILAAGVFVGEGELVQSLPFLALGLSILLVKLWMERVFRNPSKAGPNDSTALQNGARLMHGPLRGRSRFRLLLAGLGMLVISGCIVSVVLGGPDLVVALSVLAMLICTLGELVERHLYFTAEASPSMPGH